MDGNREDALDALRARLIPLPPGKWLVGFSGGADSTALLTLLLPLRSEAFQLEAVHVNHGLRGAESEGDAAFAQDFCQAHAIPFHLYTPNLQGRRDENSARRARYACFRDCVAKTGAEGMLLAHHQDDQAETFLMRLLRGAGAAGLQGMKPEAEIEGMRVIRPLLGLTRQELREALAEAGVPWREDSSNENSAYLRNAVRNGLLPEMEKLTPGVGQRLAQAATLLARDEELLTSLTERWLDAHAGSDWLDGEALEKEMPALQSRVLRRWAGQEIFSGDQAGEKGLSYTQTEELMAAARIPGGSCNLPGGARALRGKRYLHLITGRKKEMPPVAWVPPATAFGELTLRQKPSQGEPGDGIRTQEAPADFWQGCVLRTRQPGDIIAPFGSGGHRKLQDFLTDRGVEAPFRDRVPLICRGREVLWAAGVGTGAVPNWRPREEHVRLEWEGLMIWERKGNA